MGEYKDSNMTGPVDIGTLANSLYSFVGKNFPVTWTLSPDGTKVSSISYDEQYKEGCTAPIMTDNITQYEEDYTNCELDDTDKSKIAEWIAANLPNLVEVP